MRLESGEQLGSGQRLLLRIQYLLVVATIVVAVLVWLPAPEFVAPLATAGLLLVLAYIWFVAGLQLVVPVLKDRDDILPGVLAVLAPAMAMAWAGLLAPPVWGAGLLFVAVLLQRLVERAPTFVALWPAQWQQSRRQQSQLLLVALASIGVAQWYPLYWG